MCGIIGAIAKQDVVSLLINGLKHLEYRGYDSAGIAVLNQDHQLIRVRTTEKIEALEKRIKEKHLSSYLGIAHTRWATHGDPNEKNAHPHMVGDKVAIVHNGIIENYQTLREQLLAKHCVIESETDSELIAHLIYLNMQSEQDVILAIKHSIQVLQGAFAVALIINQMPQHLFAIRNGSPLVIGLSEEGSYVASDVQALLPVTNQFIFLQDGDIADVTANNIIIYDKDYKKVKRKVHQLEISDTLASKGKYAHFMLKEIFEQPKAIKEVYLGRITKDKVLSESFGFHAPTIFEQIKRIQIVACGTSFHAGLVAKYWFEEIAKIPCQVEIASEYRYRHPVVEKNTLFVAISQSGETADTLAALGMAKANGYLSTLAICNVARSSLTRESDLTLLTNAGPEIGVASTKAFTTQLLALFLLVLCLEEIQHDNKALIKDALSEIIHLPKKIEEVLSFNSQIEDIAKSFDHVNHALYIGRGMEFPIALEGALKLKEISYIHAQACPAGELKHGPLALVDEETPVIALAPHDELIDKVKSNLAEVLARHGRLIVFADQTSHIQLKNNSSLIIMPPIHRYLAPILYTVPLQLLAYHVARLKGHHIDQPRNLAKSVTVE